MKKRLDKDNFIWYKEVITKKRKGGDTILFWRRYECKPKEVSMKRFAAIGIACMLLAGLTGCQIPGGTETIEKITEAVEMMEEVEMQLDEMQAQIDELTEAFNELADSYDKHMEKYHSTKVVTPKPKPKEKPPIHK